MWFAGNVAIPTATMQLEIDSEIVQDAGFGVGPVDATFKAIRKITRTRSDLMQFTINAVTGGTDAQGEATVRLKEKGNTVIGQGAHGCDGGQRQGLYQCTEQDRIQEAETRGNVKVQGEVKIEG